MGNGNSVLTPELITAIAGLVVSLGAKGMDLFVKMESLANLGPDEKVNIANAIAASKSADADTLSFVAGWMKANGVTPTFALPAAQ